MADAATTPAVVETPPEDAAADTKRDADLAELFRQPEADEPAAEKAAEAPTSPQAAPADPGLTERLAKLEKEQGTLRDRNVALETELNIRRMGLDREAAPEAPKAPVAGPKLNMELLRTDPQAAMDEYVEAKLAARLPEAQAAAVTQATARAAEMQAFNQQFLADQRDTGAEYGELLTSNPDFHEAATKIYNQITANSPHTLEGGQKWAPRALYTATSIAYAQFAKAGKFKEGNGLPKLVEKPKTPFEPVTGSTGSSGGAGSTPGMEGYSASEISQINSTCRRMGITPEAYFKRVASLKRSDKGFGS